MRLVCYPLLSTRSKWALEREVKPNGEPYHYAPRTNLILRLAHELSREPREVEEQLMRERHYLLKNKRDRVVESGNSPEQD
jgi:hypothetical protein